MHAAVEGTLIDAGDVQSRAANAATLGVGSFTHKAIEYTAHGLLVIDLILFLVYILKSSFDLVK